MAEKFVQDHVRERTKEILAEQAELRRKWLELGEELKRLEKMCQRTHVGDHCHDCSWEPN